MHGCRTLCLVLAALVAGQHSGSVCAQAPAARPKFKARRTAPAERVASIEPVAASASDTELRKVTPAVATSVPEDSPLAGFLARLHDSRRALAEVRDYTCLLAKEELIGRKLTAQTMSVKLRSEPLSFYMLFDGVNRGREALFVEGVNQNRVLVHETNIPVVGNVTVPLALNAPEITRENRYPITNVGLHKLTEIVTGQITREASAADVKVEEFPTATLAGRTCYAFRATFEQPQRGRTFHQTVAYFDKETNFMVRLEQYAFPRSPREKPILVEKYSYTKIQPNVGLTDRDFDPRNRAYHFQ